MQRIGTREMPRRSAVRAKIMLAGFAALIPPPVPPCSQDPAVKKQQHLERGMRQLETGKYNEAVIELKNGLQLDPNFVPALHAPGRPHSAQGWHLDAARELARAAEREPKAIPIRLLLGQAYLAGGDPKRAEEQGNAI